MDISKYSEKPDPPARKGIWEVLAELDIKLWIGIIKSPQPQLYKIQS